ncbi:MAG: 2-succinyl-5-enolpyruvyl-6-hydroxy-3-cyclohexene-1-carboxylic-acid synthase [Muribaculaceae bacterium]
MKTTNENTAHLTCRWLAEMLAEHGAEWVVCCPGSRNTPLLMAFARENRLRKTVVVDERSAGYVAIGIAQQTRRPVAVVCTSGTALLNLAPASAEAYYSKVPLIIVSADRPQQWIDQNDSQTLRQPLALSQVVKWHTSLPSRPSTADERWWVRRMLNEAWQKVTTSPMATVHINIHISEPIAETTQTNEYIWSNIICPNTTPRLANADAQMLASQVAAKSRIMVVCGVMPPNDELNGVLCQMANRNNCVVLAEPISNIRGVNIISHPEQALCELTPDNESRLAPDLVIYIGGALVSRRIKEFLRSQNCQQWRVGIDNNIIDTFKHLTCNIAVEPEELFSHLAAVKQTESSYASDWAAIALAAQNSHEHLVMDFPWSSLVAINAISRHLPKATILHLSNGLSVRLAQLCNTPQVEQWWSNRGTSGIDGSTSTALGASLVADESKNVVLITGDMSFNYDLNALNTDLNYSRLKIIVLCNGGGGIFRFINTTATLPELEEYMEVKHSTPVADFARTFGFDYFAAENLLQLNEALPQFFGNHKQAILAVYTDSTTDATVLNQYYNRNK